MRFDYVKLVKKTMSQSGWVWGVSYRVESLTTVTRRGLALPVHQGLLYTPFMVFREQRSRVPLLPIHSYALVLSSGIYLLQKLFLNLSLLFFSRMCQIQFLIAPRIIHKYLPYHTSLTALKLYVLMPSPLFHFIIWNLALCLINCD